MAGSILRPSFKDIKPDLNSIKLLPKFLKKILEGGDNNLLKLVIFELEKIGFKVLNLKTLLPEIFLGREIKQVTKFQEINLYDIKKENKF